jgi:hypothetical protein
VQGDPRFLASHSSNMVQQPMRSTALGRAYAHATGCTGRPRAGCTISSSSAHLDPGPWPLRG